MYSAGLPKWLTECAITISTARIARFTVTKSSTHSAGLCTQRSFGWPTILWIRVTHSLAGMLPPQFVGLMLQFHRLGKKLVIAMPLDEVGAAHECAMFARPPVVVPQIEIRKVDRMAERWPTQ